MPAFHAQRSIKNGSAGRPRVDCRLQKAGKWYEWLCPMSDDLYSDTTRQQTVIGLSAMLYGSANRCSLVVPVQS